MNSTQLPLLALIGLTLISGALSAALTFLIIARKLKKQPFNYPPAMLIQFVSLMICLGSIYGIARLLIENQPPTAEAEQSP